MRKQTSLVAAACLALLLGGCSFGEAPVTDAERQVGDEAHPQLLAQFGGVYGGEERAYLAQIGARMAAAAGLEGQCTFTLINSDVVNAFAVPGCYIYVTRGLMAIVNSEAELASVLAHEVGHIAANHSERQERRSLIRGLGVAAITALTGSERLKNFAGAAAALFGLRYSRSHEYEADELGVRYLRQAGYDPYAAIEMLDALGRHQQFLTATRGRDEANAIPEWALTHPLTERRVARARAAAEQTGVAPDVLVEKQPEYLRELDGLLYGDDPQQGFVTGRRFAHPVMRIGFEAPPGFTLSNTPEAILLDGPDGLRGMFSGGRLPTGGLPAYAEATLRQLFGDAPVELSPATATTVNGVPTLVVRGFIETRQGTVMFSMAAYEGATGDAFHFVMISRPGATPPQALEALYRSFRVLSTAEAASLRPRRIRTVRVGAAETLRDLAARMATDQPIDHFVMLNDRTAQQPLRPGEIVKIVANTPN